MSADCPTYVEPRRSQLGPDGGRYGNVGCTPGAFARATNQATCGAEDFTGAQVRAASNEPIPSRTSPGLNMDQGDDAIYRLTRGRVNFDTRRMYPALEAIDRILAGEPAVVQYQRSAQIAMGKGGGNVFGGGHAGKLDGVGGLHLFDNLVPRFALTTSQAVTLMGSLLVPRNGRLARIGRGNAYVSFGPDNTADWHVSIPKAGFRDGQRHAFGLWIVDPVRRIVLGRPTRRYTKGMSANVARAARFAYRGDSQSLCVLLDGGLAAEAAAKGYTYAVVSGYALKGAV